MADLKIRVFKGAATKPKTTITIPGGVLKVASRLIPRRAAKALEDKGIDLQALVELAQNPEVRGTVVEIEEHAKDERVLIALE